MGSLILTLSLLLLSYVCIATILNYRRLRQFKGPPLAGLSRAWMFWRATKSTLYQAEIDAIKQYGSPCRIGPNLLISDDADVVRHLNAPGSKWSRSSWYDGVRMDPRQDTVFSTRDERLHADLKGKEYYGRDIDTLEPDMDARIAELLNLIRDNYSHVTMDFAKVADYFTLDVLSTVAFGRPFGFMAENADKWSYGKQTSEFMGLLELQVNHVSVRWILQSPLMQWLVGPKPTDKSGLGAALGFAHTAIAERYGPDAKTRNDMLGHLVKKGLSKLQVEAESFLMIVAGTDPVATVLRMTLFLLLGTPTAYTKLQHEIDSATTQNRLSTPIATYAEAQKLPYLGACIWEAIRMYPPLFGTKAKLAPRGGDTIKGIYYPEGCELGICDQSLCRNTAIFGRDAELFRPDRWVEADGATRALYRNTVDTVFSAGRSKCLGQHIAMTELHKTVVEVRESCLC
ncbi:putative P450 monooxygenase [Teratosphaeria nubilosa]|uniref:Putative P450 monooxygenase n=1 Tax=Teratosphaeria nubilosa TaxID=161662 RepID=A0A6G1L109_9PEZI|nr:putative P450 monooxygenase [Teratosphaeria nubilosa]